MPTLWFCLAAIMIAGYVLFDGFDLGAGIVQLFVARTDRDTAQVLGSIGPVWDGNEVWLLAAGGALFFAFPALYASAFSGFYLPLMMVLWLLILRGIGIALGNVVRGVPLDQSGYFFLPLWTNLIPSDQVGIIDWYTLLVGAASFLVLAIHGSLWVVLKTEGSLQERTRSFSAKCWGATVVVLLLMSGASFSIQPNLVHQFRSQPWGLVFPALTVAGVIGTRVLSSRRRDLQGFLASGLSLVGMLTSAAFGVFPNVLPSNTAPAFSLTIYNAATAEHGLIVGLFWFLPGMALAVSYSSLVYRHFNGKVA